jgi:hypothetical protein
MAVRQRNYRRARDRALARLAQAHKGEYLDYLAEEKAKDEQEGKRWYNLAGSDVPTQFSISDLSTGKVGRDTSDISQNESDNE